MDETPTTGTPGTTTNWLRGRFKVALILELADGDYGTYDDLAAKYGISNQGVVMFASRHRDQIEAAKRDLTSELRGLWVVNKQARLSDAEHDLEDLEERLQDETLSHAARRGYLSLKMKLRHSIADECGQLVSRGQFEVHTAALGDSDVIALDTERSYGAPWSL